jgi:uncharacterized protein YcnI
MRFSAWSLRVISVSSAALVFAAPAWAHLSVSPTRVAPGALVDLTFGAPNEDDDVGISRVTLAPPPGFDLDDAEAKTGWTQSRAGGAITWSGGNIPKGQYATFSIRGTAPERTGTIVFNVAVGDRTGKSITYRVALDVASKPHDYGKAALIVAVAGAALALLAFFLALYVWLRPPR